MERNKNCFRYFKEIHSLSMKKLKHLDVRTEDELPGSVSPSSDETDSIRSHIKKMGPICKSRKKFVHVSPLSSMAEDDNFDEQILSNGSFISTADDETMWLSSGCFSPSSFFKERNGSDEWLVSWLSTMASASTDLDSSSQASEAENIEDLNGDEPIFWPFERKIDWKSEETWKHFTMSPRKDIIKVTALEETVNTNKNLQKPKQGSKDCHNGGHKIREGNTMPSRLRESTKVSAKIVPLNIENQILALKVEEDDIMGSISTCRNLWKDDFTSNGDVPIEKVVGLGEFDGHEGIDSDFNEGVFLLDEAL
ncbi:hypothetical protein ES319_A02G017500v1 [Gossypium barbadense]|uniref:Uncharacterized protein n=1 Tax=Gossypium barbadense TaxID=3634 RepID=A0A5J5WK89_GOSBA|nr:hypothetical protein ES319_A02G017500v1 [Gossypium barbadense]